MPLLIVESTVSIGNTFPEFISNTADSISEQEIAKSWLYNQYLIPRSLTCVIFVYLPLNLHLPHLQSEDSAVFSSHIVVRRIAHRALSTVVTFMLLLEWWGQWFLGYHFELPLWSQVSHTSSRGQWNNTRIKSAYWSCPAFLQFSKKTDEICKFLLCLKFSPLHLLKHSNTSSLLSVCLSLFVVSIFRHFFCPSYLAYLSKLRELTIVLFVLSIKLEAQYTKFIHLGWGVLNLASALSQCRSPVMDRPTGRPLPPASALWQVAWASLYRVIMEW